jgi:predicted ATPase/DNA-binding XRE family transcriptional regulator
VAEQLEELLRSFRSAALLSQEALAERSGLSTRTVSDIEAGSARTPRLITIMLLAEGMNLSSADRVRLREAARKTTVRAADAAVVPANLIHAPTLIGRNADAVRIGALLSRDDVQLVTLVAPAGVGKTSLAVKVALGRAPAERAATMVELGPVAEPSLVPAAVTRALGIGESPGTPAIDAIKAYLRDRSALLVLDNLEHLTPAAAWITTLLAQCPRLTLLATSREPLHLRTEYVYAVRPLESDAAIKLFVQRAQMVKPELELSDTNLAAIRTIVEHLDGLPLAIELAAPRLLLLPPQALAARLQRRLPLLGDGGVDRPARQRTMRGAIAWSYDLLSTAEQQLFRRLSIFQGGGTLEAASAVAGLDDGERSILTLLAPLVDKNMLLLLEDTTGEPRVSMLEMLREFGQERLVETQELADARQRHAASVLAFARRANLELLGAEQRTALEQFELESANIRSALEWAAGNAATLFAFHLLSTVWRFWCFRGHLTEAVAWMRRFLSVRAQEPATVPDSLYTNVLHGHVVLLSALGNFDDAFAPCEEAIQLQRRLGDEAGLAASYTCLGIILQFRAEYDRAEEVYREGLAIQTRLGDEAGTAASLSSLASVSFGKNGFARAAELGDASVAIYRRLGQEVGLAHALMKIGLAAFGERNYERAEEIFGECLRLQRAVGNVGSMFYSIANLATVAQKRGDYELALTRYHEALDLLDSIPAKVSLAALLGDLAATISALGDPARAARLLGAADALRRAIHVPLYESERADFDVEVAKVRTLLGAEAFEVQWDIGTSSTLERALEEARATRRRQPHR